MSENTPQLKSFPDGIAQEQWNSIMATHGEVIMLLWTTWCPSCKLQHPIFDQLAREFRSICFVSINLEKSRWIQKHTQVAGVPTYFFFRSGAQVFRATGDFSAFQLMSKIQGAFLT